MGSQSCSPQGLQRGCLCTRCQQELTQNQCPDCPEYMWFWLRFSTSTNFNFRDRDTSTYASSLKRETEQDVCVEIAWAGYSFVHYSKKQLFTLLQIKPSVKHQRQKWWVKAVTDMVLFIIFSSRVQGAFSAKDRRANTLRFAGHVVFVTTPLLQLQIGHRQHVNK